LVVDGAIDPCRGQVYPFDEVGHAHQLMYEGKNPSGKTVILVGSPRIGEGIGL
jgi:crotonyl-CoA carboxylase/reductase